MVKLLKYFLSLSTLIVCACTPENTGELSYEDRQKLSLEILSEGERLYQGSPKSMTRIQKAILIDSTNSEALRELSVPYLKRGMMAQWKVGYDKAVEVNPEVWIPMRGYLHLLFHRDYDKAISDFNMADSLTPGFKDSPQGHSIDYWRGIAYIGKKNYDKAIENFENHSSIETENVGEDWIETTTFLYNGIAYFKKEQYEEALVNFDKMIKYNHNITGDGNFYKAKTLLALKRDNEAGTYAEKALIDFNNGAYHKHDYVEVLHQLYKNDITELIDNLNN